MLRAKAHAGSTPVSSTTIGRRIVIRCNACYNYCVIKWNRRKYTEAEFISAWSESLSIAECARTLNLNIYGSTYITIKETAKELGLNGDHMIGSGHLKGKTHNFNSRPIQEILVYGKHEHTGRLKDRLYKEGLKEKKCEVSECGLTEWMGQPAPLSLDHIDGDRLNNALENLRILCYNCHGQTETYCRKKE